MSRVFTGIQPSGALTIGHYVGTIKNWLELQQQHDCLFCVVDLHAITVAQQPATLKHNIQSLFAMYLACGLDYKKHSIFVQSQVPAHAQMAWLLQSITPVGQLQRMTQFKDKSSQHGTNTGLLTYPTLMAGDILLYDADLVPVGADQKQHLELTRDLVLKFNSIYGNVLVMPEPIISAQGARIMSLQEPSKKMSKSDPNNGAWLSLLDEEIVIVKKIKRAVTDSMAKVNYDLDRPGISNLIVIYSILSGKSFSEIEKKYNGLGYGVFKTDLSELIIEEFLPIQHRYREIIAEPESLSEIMALGAERANAYAEQVLNKVKKVMGL